LRAVAVDRAGNRSEPSESASFVSKSTRPRITLISPANGAYIGRLARFTVQSADSVGLASVGLQYSYDRTQGFVDVGDRQPLTGGAASTEFELDTTGLDERVIYVRATAYDVVGRVSDGTPVQTYMIDHTPPAPPAGFKLTAAAPYIYASWQAPASDPSFDKFILYKASPAEGETEPGAGAVFARLYETGSVLGYYDKGVRQGLTYRYYAVAADKAGNESEPTAILSAAPLSDTEKPYVYSMYPTNAARLKSGTTITASIVDDVQLQSVTLYVSDGGAGAAAWREVETKTLTQPSELVSFAAWSDELPEGAVSLKLVVADATGNLSNDYLFSYTLDNTPPQALSLLPLSPESGLAAGVSWTALPGEDDISYFRVYMATSESGPFSPVAQLAKTATQYVATGIMPGDYWFKVTATDAAGNEGVSEVCQTEAQKNDHELPIAAITGQNESVAGTPILLSAAASTDNDRIASFSWDFGDGSAPQSDVVAKHVYAAPGRYTVTLSVTDIQGNTGTTALSVTVYDEGERTVLEITVTGRDASGVQQALPNATVVVAEDEAALEPVVADGDGKAFIVVNNGGNKEVTAFAGGYEVTNKSVNADGETHLAVPLAMNRNDYIGGVLSVKRMDYDEIIAAGIDVTDPENQFLWKFELVFEFTESEKTFVVPYYVNHTGTIVGGGGGGVGGAWAWSGGGTGWGVQGYIPSGNPSAPPTVVFLTIYGNASWLKEFFQVDLDIVNFAPEGCDIADLNALLDVPEGLSLAPLPTPQNARFEMGAIAGGGGKASASWIIRGDAAGEYTLSADVSGFWFDGVEIQKKFVTQEPFRVWAGDALKLYVTADEKAFKGHPYNVSFSLVNVSEIDLYNVRFEIEGTKLTPTWDSPWGGGELPP
ncbi:MAG: PKD domain-containing protein, partial [Clostridiales bacterium]|nr:PKD domain-containing protein [Clostridiales bacterium]